jgi:Family of unknown function (DUF6879)
MRKFPADQAEVLHAEWMQRLKCQWFKLAVRLDGTVEGPSFEAWCQEKYDLSRQLMYERSDKSVYWNETTAGLRAGGVEIIRVHLDPVDGRSAYLEWLLEHFRRINRVRGLEDVFALSPGEWAATEEGPPATDEALFDGWGLVRTYYTPAGVDYREFYEYDPGDEAVVQAGIRQVAALKRVLTLNHLLPMIAPPTSA